MTSKKADSLRVPIERAIVYYSEIHQSPSGEKWQIKVYWLNDCYILMSQNGGSYNVLSFTDLTTMRYELNQIIRDIERGVYE